MTSKKSFPNPWDEFIRETTNVIAEATGLSTEVLTNLVEEPPDPKLGDLATTVSFYLAKERKQNPLQIASDIVQNLEKLIESVPLLNRVDSKGPYINLFFDRGFYCQRVISTVKEILQDYGTSEEFKGKRALIESPAVNPSKPWHIGHTRNAVLGDTLGNLLEAVGFDVIRLDYINDLGLQIAQLTWKLREIGTQETDAKYDHYLGQLYVDVQTAFESDKNVLAKIRAVAKQLEEPSSEVAKISEKMVTRCVKAQNQTGYRLGIYHDYQIWESCIAHSGLLQEAKNRMLEAENIVLLEEGEKAGCIVAKLDALDEFKDMKDPNKVLFRSDSTRTYTGADVALQMWKFGILKDPFNYTVFEKQPNGVEVLRTVINGSNHSMGKFDLVFNVIGAPQAHPQKLIYVILDLLGYQKQSENSHHIAYEFVGLEDVGFSGRKGTWVGYSCDVVLDRAFELAKEEVTKRNPDETEEFKNQVAESVASGAIRYFLLNASPDRRITFRWEEVLDFNGDAAPYLQYSYARAQRILERAEYKESMEADLKLLIHDAEFELLKAIAKYPQEVLEVARGLKKQTWGTSFQSNRLTSHSFNLATLFSKFYDACPVLKAEPRLREARLALVEAFKITMANSLNLLGIPIVERM